MRLQAVPGIGPVGCKQLIERFGSPSAVFADKGILAESGLRPDLAGRYGEEQYLRWAEDELEFATKRGIRCISYLDPGYPAGLLQCADGPPVLFTRGAIRFDAGPLVSVVGTRGMTEYGRQCCEAFIRGIAPINPIIISGYAYGIDITAQRTAMSLGLQTIACMAHGLDRVYPAAHRRYEGELLENGGYLSEFPRGTLPEPGHFLRRNRVIAGLSPATVVIESGERGGSLVTAGLAFGYNREVFAFPGRVTDMQSRGCHQLIRQQKAQLIQDAGEFLHAMGWEPEGGDPDSHRPTRLPEHLEPNEQSLARILRESGSRHLDDLAISCGISVSEALTSLFSLEMMGLVRALPGKCFCWEG
ncbi:DNA-processing protein DprA [Robiginitalea sp. SC105]|uniref:DNA-processing protein DprA n=1 Tax=Robiginitalea sp. SC105 TaxID=2762332 RepID=UPI001639D6ED|nr:DNA-processing protein DprA [Robiginitalea sp. SC105]MBC2838275.1 DNA-protecting protein DprA [Robiginitalea sp. SC105]